MRQPNKARTVGIPPEMAAPYSQPRKFKTQPITPEMWQRLKDVASGKTDGK